MAWKKHVKEQFFFNGLFDKDIHLHSRCEPELHD